jgi:multifunctional methyltransferase subunit TRM112
MRFLTHNSLRSHIKKANSDVPLEIEITDYEVDESDADEEFIRHIAPSLDWRGVQIAARAIQLDGLPTVFSLDLLNDKAFLTALHHLMMNVHVISGFLICTETGRRFPIENSIPCLMLVFRSNCHPSSY